MFLAAKSKPGKDAGSVCIRYPLLVKRSPWAVRTTLIGVP